MVILIAVGVLLLATVILSVVLHSEINKVDSLKTDTTKRGLVERSLRDMVGQISSERDVAIAEAQQLKIKVTVLILRISAWYINGAINGGRW